jgi:uncharacterized membrane protein
MVWLPFVTFWQVSADLAFSTGVPGGHGHKYTTEQVDGWSAVMHGAGQDTAVLDRVKQVIAQDDD